MSNVIKFNQPTQVRDKNKPLFTLTVYKDRSNDGEVIARFDAQDHLSHDTISEYLDQISLKAKNTAASNGNEKGRVALIVTQYENSVEFIENASIPKDMAYIQNLKQEFQNIICALESLENDHTEV